MKKEITQKRIMKRKKGRAIREALEQLNIGEGFNKQQFIISVWGDADYFLERAFDAMFCEIKKEFTDRTFKCIKKIITRTS
jgi:hypothetical protein